MLLSLCNVIHNMPVKGRIKLTQPTVNVVQPTFNVVLPISNVVQPISNVAVHIQCYADHAGERENKVNSAKLKPGLS